MIGNTINKLKAALGCSLLLFIPSLPANSKPCVDDNGPNARKSIVIWDTKALAPLTFQKTVWNTIRQEGEPENSGENHQARIEKFVEGILTTLSQKAATTDVGQVVPLEALLPDHTDYKALAKRLLNPKDDLGLVPTAAFNRFDLAPLSLDDCGEYRIVYSFRKETRSLPLDDQLSRFFLIFEARVKNVNITGKSIIAVDQRLVDGCTEIISQWSEFPLIPNTQIAKTLKRFFYTKVAPNRPRGIRAEWVGGDNGQIRGNIKIVRDQIWQLRQWQLDVTNSDPILVTAPLTDSPQVELFDNYATAQSPILNKEFQKTFAMSHAKSLVDPVVCGVISPKLCPEQNSASAVINKLGISKISKNKLNISKYNDYQNITQYIGNNDKIDNIDLNSYSDFYYFLKKYVKPNTSTNQKISYPQLVRRLHTISCAGCHQLSNRKILGNINNDYIRWPFSNSFTHIKEPEQNTSLNVRASKALRKFFIPFRQKILCQFLENRFIDDKKIDVFTYLKIRNLEELLKSNIGNPKELIRIRNQIKIIKENENGLFIPYRRSH